MSARAVFVDDNENLSLSTEKLLQARGFKVDCARSLESARPVLRKRPFDIAFVDLMLPDGNGLELIDEFRDDRHKMVVMTGHPRLERSLEALGEPRPFCLAKPFTVADLIDRIKRISPDADFGNVRRVLDDRGAFASWIGNSAAIEDVRHQIRSVAKLDTTVFLLGESGTGKELAAHALHALSGREGAFVSVNCGAMPENLISSELFGHERGSFTGASRSHAGVFERADGGTLFLDEITELPLDMQPHLLRAIETHNVVRVGGKREIPVDVRIVAASNRVRTDLINQQVLREDLYYRLMVFPIRLPAVRERRDDIPLFIDSFLGAWNRKHGAATRIPPADVQRLSEMPWPGNVRELKHTIERLAILADDDVASAAGVPQPPLRTDTIQTLPVGMSIKELEQRLILATLAHYGGDKPQAADTLGISIKTLYNRLKEYGARGVPAPKPDRLAG